ncbi:GNAT family N-acetyltransferase [Alloprevotella rava]|nr:GNAT family N-acetyltransferase [Alloprevotella rava]
MQTLFRPARPTDFDAVFRILRGAAKTMVAKGRQQWDEHYPAKADLQADFNLGIGYVIEENAEVVAYAAISFRGEPAYDVLEGHWLSDMPYAVVHRMAVLHAALGRGHARHIFSEVERLCREREVGSIRIDTNYDNVEMLSLVRHLGFIYCGKVYYQRGTTEKTERLAFEKRL